MTLDDLLGLSPVLPVLTIRSADDAVPLARALLAGGVRVAEVTLRTPAALDAIRRIAAEAPDVRVGAGTVLSPADLDAAAEAGAAFAISPGSTPELLEAGRKSPIPYLPAITTAGELMAGLARGYDRFKFFPAMASGGVETLKAFNGPFPAVRFCPTGGVTPANAPALLSLPNVLCVGGSWLAPEALVQAAAWSQIQQLAREAAALRP